jgi:hypothetical protein
MSGESDRIIEHITVIRDLIAHMRTAEITTNERTLVNCLEVSIQIIEDQCLTIKKVNEEVTRMISSIRTAQSRDTHPLM